jgi:death-on-curing protein
LSDPVFLSEEQIVRIHDEQIRLYGGSPGLLDGGLLSSAVIQPQNACFYGGKRSPFDLAAEYAFSLAKNHAFQDGNKRTGAAAAIAFLEVNGWLVEEHFTEEMLALVTGKMTKSEFSSVLKRVSKRVKIIDLVAALHRLLSGE